MFTYGPWFLIITYFPPTSAVEAVRTLKEILPVYCLQQSSNVKNIIGSEEYKDLQQQIVSPYRSIF